MVHCDWMISGRKVADRNTFLLMNGLKIHEDAGIIAPKTYSYNAAKSDMNCLSVWSPAIRYYMCVCVCVCVVELRVLRVFGSCGGQWFSRWQHFVTETVGLCHPASVEASIIWVHMAPSTGLLSCTSGANKQKWGGLFGPTPASVCYVGLN